MDNRLLNYGFPEKIIEEASLQSGFFLGRVISQSKDLYKIVTKNSEIIAEISGKLRYSSNKLSD